MGKLRDLRNRADSELYKKIGVLCVLFILSCVSTFGIYNTFGPNVISMIAGLETATAKFANVAILGLFTATLFYLGITSNVKKTAGENMKLGGLIILSLCAIGGFMIMTNSVIYPLISMSVVGITFILFRMMMSTINVYGVFALAAGFIAAPVVAYTSGALTTGSGFFTFMQVIMTAVVFIGATYPRLRAILFRVRTQDNVEMSHGAGQEESDGA